MHNRDVLVVAGVLLTLSGCAAILRQEAAMTEQLLTEAGFQRRAADTPERVQDLTAMPPLKMVARSQGHDVRYTFADPYRCRCLYVGGSKEYSLYQRLLAEQETELNRVWAEQDTMNWAVWGPSYY